MAASCVLRPYITGYRHREGAEETRATTRDLGIAFVAYSPLGRSLLAAAGLRYPAGGMAGVDI
jgi:aryl-alcohol dehydrogenase-like predicted oxidoreductase